MTTNVFDSDAWELASDSRWSIDVPAANAIVYVDDTEFDKLIAHDAAASMFAGDSEAIGLWKQWISDPERPHELPDPEGITVCIVNVETGQVDFERGEALVEGGSRFAGSGKEWARPCWIKNRNAKMAVETAKTADRFSGGTVKFLHAKTGANNLSTLNDVAHVRQELQRRGMVMYSNSKAVSLAEAAEVDPHIKEIVEKISRGEESLKAQCPSISKPWTAQEKADLYAVMKQHYPPAKK